MKRISQSNKESEERKVRDLKRQKLDQQRIISWCIPEELQDMPQAIRNELRAFHQIHIATNGQDVPPMIPSFQLMKFPKRLIKYLSKKQIQEPTSFQMQALPIILEERDFIGIGAQGQGKKLCYQIPIIMRCMEQEKKLKFVIRECPFAVIIMPSRELAQGVYDQIKEMTRYLNKKEPSSFPKIKTLLAIGGIDIKQQSDAIDNDVVHIVVGTPGRISDLVDKKRLSFMDTQVIVIDEADRFMEVGFDNELKTIMGQLNNGMRPYKAQVIMVSQNLPQKIDSYQQMLFQAAILSKNIWEYPIFMVQSENWIQNQFNEAIESYPIKHKIEFIKKEEKLQKTLELIHHHQELTKQNSRLKKKPIVIYSENRSELEDIREYLSLKEIKNVISIPHNLIKQERYDAIMAAHEAKILILSDFAVKGVDLHIKQIPLLINYDIPKTFDTYLQRLAKMRRGWSAKNNEKFEKMEQKSVTFINKSVDIDILKEIKQLMIRNNLKVPELIKDLEELVCQYCNEKGHSEQKCLVRALEAFKDLNEKLLNQ